MKRSYLRPVSDKQRRKNAEWLAAREAALDRDGYWPTCPQIGLHMGQMCEGGVEVHHRLPRSAGGSNDLDNLLTVCSLGHRWIHEHPAYSYERGWLLRRGATTRETA